MLLALVLLCTPASAEEPAPFEVTPFGRLFFRPEFGLNLHDYDFGGTDTDFIFTLRTNTGLDVALHNDVHVVFDLQSFGTYNLNAGPLEPGIKLYQGYIELRDMGSSPLDLRIGRFEPERYGTGMVISPDPFYDGFSLEAIRLRHDTDRNVFDVAWHQLYAPDTTVPVGEVSWRNPVLFGTHDTVQITPGLSVDAYWWWLVSKPFSGWVTQTYTFGGRVFGEAGEGVVFDYSAEGTWQTGTAKLLTDRSVTGTIGAYAVNPRVGLTAGPVRVGAEYYRASGDEDTSDNVIHSFNLMWQDPHGRFGNLDRYSGSNLQAAILSGTVKLGGERAAGLLGADATALSVLEPGDPNAGVFEDGATPDADAPTAIGLGGDFWWTQPITDQLNWDLSLSTLLPGALVEHTLNTADPLLRLYGSIEVQF